MFDDNPTAETRSTSEQSEDVFLEIAFEHRDPAFTLLLCRVPSGPWDVECSTQLLDLEAAARLHSALSVLFATAARRGIAVEP